MNFDSLEKVAFEKDALVKEIVQAPFQLAGFAAKKGVGAGSWLLGKGIKWGVAKPVHALLTHPLSPVSWASWVTGKALGAAGQTLGLAGKVLGHTALGTGQVLGKAAVPVAGAVGHGIWEAGKAGAKVVGKAEPLTLLGGALTAPLAYKSIQGHLSGGTRENIRQQVLQSSTAPNLLGRKMAQPIVPWARPGESGVMESFASAKLPSMDNLEKIAALSGFDPASLIKDLLLKPVADPIFKTLGDQINNLIHTPSTLHKTKAREKQTEMLAEFLAKQNLKKKEKALKERETRPAMMTAFENITKQDKVIGQAMKDPQLKDVVHSTLETVYSFAPDVSKDQRALQSILREAVTSPEGGLSFPTIKLLSETQKFISDAKSGGKK